MKEDKIDGVQRLQEGMNCTHLANELNRSMNLTNLVNQLNQSSQPTGGDNNSGGSGSSDAEVKK
jgi:hypothetical protein